MGDTEGAGYELDYIPIMDLVWGKGFIAPGGEGNVDRRRRSRGHGDEGAAVFVFVPEDGHLEIESLLREEAISQLEGEQILGSSPTIAHQDGREGVRWRGRKREGEIAFGLCRSSDGA